MATSGTATWNPDYGDIVEQAFRRASGRHSMMSGHDVRDARFSLNELLSEWGNRGLNLWTLEEGTQVLTASDGSYTLPADTIDLIEAHLRYGTGTSQTDITLNRISISQYARISNKNVTGAPTQFVVLRQVPPVVNLWPLPDSAMTYTLVYWRLRRIQDAGDNVSYTLDMPNRFLPALIAGLAHKIAMNNVEFVDRVPYLETYYEKQWNLAAGEDRDRTEYQIVPWVGSV